MYTLKITIKTDLCLSAYAHSPQPEFLNKTSLHYDQGVNSKICGGKKHIIEIKSINLNASRFKLLNDFN